MLGAISLSGPTRGVQLPPVVSYNIIIFSFVSFASFGPTSLFFPIQTSDSVLRLVLGEQKIENKRMWKTGGGDGSTEEGGEERGGARCGRPEGRCSAAVVVVG